MKGLNVGNGRLPNLLVVGVPKAGTGSLFAYLTQHPDICGADEKEVGYFNHFNPARHSGPPPPVESYAKHFSHCDGQRYAVEATPTYSYGGKPVIDGIQQILSRPRIILSLRNPVERLWSAYTFQRSLGNLSHISSFQEYLTVCEQRRREGAKLVPGNHLHGLLIGFYADYVGAWLAAFGDDIRIVFAEDLARDPVHVVGELFRWLDIAVEDASTLDLRARNVTRHARNPHVARLVWSMKRSSDHIGLSRLPPSVRRRVRRAYERVNSSDLAERLDAGTRRRVEDIYQRSNAKTAELLAAQGYVLPPWLQRASVRGD